MRTKMLLFAAALSAAGIVSSVAQSNVYSLNVVGYVNRDCTGNGGFTLLANPLDSHTNTLNGVLASALPANSKVLKWNGTSFVTYTRTASGWLPPTAGTVTVNPGEGFFVQTPAPTSPTVTITFVGDVLQGSLTNDYTAAYTLSGNLFPDSGTLTSLGMTPPTNNKILLWNGGYVTYTKTAAGWLPPGAGPSIQVADGFFVNAPTPFSWVRNVTVQ